MAFDTAGSTKMTAGALSATVDITAAAAGAQVYCLVPLGNTETSFTFTGWTQLLAGSESTATQYGLFRRQKIAGDTTFTVSWTATSSKGTIAWASYTGLSSSTPDELAAVTLHTAGTSFASPSLTPTAAGEWALFCCYARDSSSAANLPDGSAWAPDAALAERLDAANQAAGSASWISAEFADSNGAVTQAAHSYTATCHTAESHGGAFLLFLIPGGTAWAAAGTAAGTSSASGAFDPAALAGTAAALVAAAGSFTPAAVSASAATASSASGAFQPAPLAGTAPVSSAASGAFAPAPLAGTSAASSSAAGALAPAPLAGTAAPLSIASGAFTLSPAVSAASAASSAASCAFLPVPVTGTAVAGSSAGAGLALAPAVVSAAAVSASSAAGAFGPAALTGTAASSSAAAGSVTSGFLLVVAEAEAGRILSELAAGPVRPKAEAGAVST